MPPKQKKHDLVDVVLPKLGFDVNEGRLVAWLKEAGDLVRKGDAIAQVETEKVIVELPATESGVLEQILVPVNTAVSVGEVVARILPTSVSLDSLGSIGESNMSDSQIDYDEIRKRVEKRIKSRQEFIGHLAIFLIIMAMLWGIWFLTGAGYPWPMFPMLGWGAGVAIHGFSVYYDSSARAAARERSIQREVEREIAALQDMGAYDKPKRPQSARLSDDGEIIYDNQDEPIHRSSGRNGK